MVVGLGSISRGGVTAVLVYREASPSLTVLSGRSAGGLGASSARANGQRRSRQFRGLGFRGLGFRGSVGLGV